MSQKLQLKVFGALAPPPCRLESREVDAGSKYGPRSAGGGSKLYQRSKQSLERSPGPVLTSETKRRIDACRNVLVGKLPLPTDEVELITLAPIYQFMDDLDEQSVQMGGRRSFFTGELERYRWRNLLLQTISAEQRVALFSGGLEAMSNTTRASHLPLLFRDIFRNAFLKFRDGQNSHALLDGNQRLRIPVSERAALIDYLQSHVPLKEFDEVK